MKYSAMRELPHPDALRALVTRVAHGIAAAEHTGRVIALPHCADVGGGQAYISWNPDIVVRPDSDVSWSVTERGQRYTGEFHVYADGSVTGDYPPGADQPVKVTAQSLVDDGRIARFHAVTALERHVTALMRAASQFVAREIDNTRGDEATGWGADENTSAADRVEIDVLVSELLWGEAGSPGSVVLRMVDRAAKTSINNQPLGTWFHKNLRARCEESVRRHIGDPHVGRKIRQVARETSPRSLEELIESYRRAHPRDSVGRQRVIDALSAGKTLDSVASSLTTLIEFVDDDASLSDSHNESIA